jgi:LMBR1 domain-containing protein 1
LCGGLNMTLFWDIFFWLIPIWVFLMIPFSSFYYEADDGMLMAGTSVNPNPVKKSRILSALGYTMGVVVFVSVFFWGTYYFLNETHIPVVGYTGPKLVEAMSLGKDRWGVLYSINPQVNVTSDETTFLPFTSDQLKDMTLYDEAYSDVVVDNGTAVLLMQVGLSTFFAALMAWLGWFLFSIFGGIGMASMPLDLLLVFKNRPRHMDAVEFAEAQKNLRDRVNELVDIGELIKIERDNNPGMGKVGGIGNYMNADKRKEARIERQAVLEFKQGVFLLEQDVEDFKACTSNYENYNPLRPYISLFLGICSLVVSVVWIIHIIVYIFPQPNPWLPFLNSYFAWFDQWFALFGVLSVALFTIYLLFAAITGCFKFGLRVACIQLHPMILGKTYMSSFLFNVGLVLLCAMPVVQFSAQAFRDYARNTTINQIFNVQIENLVFFGYWFTRNIFVYVFLSFFGLTLLYLLIKPKDSGPSGVALRDRLRSRKG